MYTFVIFFEPKFLVFFQVPLAILTAKYVKGQWGNVVVWGSLIIGQPIAILMYYVDYYLSLNP